MAKNTKKAEETNREKLIWMINQKKLDPMPVLAILADLVERLGQVHDDIDNLYELVTEVRQEVGLE